MAKHLEIWLAHKTLIRSMSREAIKPRLINKTWLIWEIFRNNLHKVPTMEFYKSIWVQIIKIIKNKIKNPLKICNNQI